MHACRRVIAGYPCILRGMRAGTFDVVYNSPLTLAPPVDSLCVVAGRANVGWLAYAVLTLSWDCVLNTFDNLFG